MATPNLTGITAVSPKVLASTQVAAGDVTVYTVPANKAAKVAKAVFTNTSASPVVISLAVVPSGQAVATARRIISALTLAAGDTTVVNELEGVWLGDGDFLSVNAGTATAINVLVSGLEFA